MYNEQIFQELYEACGRKFQPGCGSYLFDGVTYEYAPIMYEKQHLLEHVVKGATNVLEIGTYMGHSLMIMLESNPLVTITCIDIDDTYTRPCVEVLNKHYNNRVTFIHGDSLKVLPSLIGKETFDLFHIDGHHAEAHILSEFLVCIVLNNPKGNMRIVFDDQECMESLQKYINDRFNVRVGFKPKCKWNNVYYELKL
jgi:tRNA G46 methylase TrmB